MITLSTHLNCFQEVIITIRLLLPCAHQVTQGVMFAWMQICSSIYRYFLQSRRWKFIAYFWVCRCLEIHKQNFTNYTFFFKSQKLIFSVSWIPQKKTDDDSFLSKPVGFYTLISCKLLINIIFRYGFYELNIPLEENI